MATKKSSTSKKSTTSKVVTSGTQSKTTTSKTSSSNTNSLAKQSTSALASALGGNKNSVSTDLAKVLNNFVETVRADKADKADKDENDVYDKFRSTIEENASSKTTNKLDNSIGITERLLMNALDGLRINDLNAYVNPTLRNDFIRDRQYIQNALDAATNAAFDAQRFQAIQDALRGEDTNYQNTKNAISEMRRNLIGSASSGANVGAANATALQALLGMNQQNTELTTEGLRNLFNIGKERAAQLAQNAVDAINTANQATNDMYGVATSAYGSDRSYASQGAAEALAGLVGTRATNAANKSMNDATNKSQEAVAKMNAAAQKYVADQELAGTKYSAKKAQDTKQKITYINK